MRRTQVDSRSIASIGYESGALEVRFRNGGIYRYFDVPEEVHSALVEADSKGRFFNRQIRDAYRAERVKRAEPIRVSAASSP